MQQLKRFVILEANNRVVDVREFDTTAEAAKALTTPYHRLVKSASIETLAEADIKVEVWWLRQQLSKVGGEVVEPKRDLRMFHSNGKPKKPKE
jgi:hypothetical protein